MSEIACPTCGEPMASKRQLSAHLFRSKHCEAYRCLLRTRAEDLMQCENAWGYMHSVGVSAEYMTLTTENGQLFTATVAPRWAVFALDVLTPFGDGAHCGAHDLRDLKRVVQRAQGDRAWQEQFIAVCLLAKVYDTVDIWLREQGVLDR